MGRKVVGVEENKVSEVGVVVRGTCRGHHKSRDMAREVVGKSFSACSWS